MPSISPPLNVERAATRTHVGHAMKVNEDAVLELSDFPLFAVADGTGGTYGSTLAMDLLRRRRTKLKQLSGSVTSRDQNTESRLSVTAFFDLTFNEASRSIFKSKEAFGSRQVATTLVAALVVDRFCYIAHVGNSRAYLYRDHALTCVTIDHTLAMAQRRMGEITEDEYRTSPFRKALTQALGLTPQVDVDVAEVRLRPNDRVLLCTDGLTHLVDESTIADLMALDDAEVAADKLIQRSLDAGGTDNISVSLLHIGGESTGTHADISTELGRIFLFQSLSRPERFFVAPYLAEHTFEAGEPICKEGDIGNAAFMIESGEVQVTRDGTVLTSLGAGANFGELALARKGRRTATVTATKRTHCYILSRDRFRELVHRRPELGIRMLLPLLDALGERLDDLSVRVGSMHKQTRT
jgi:serine/threonine protein phosphatase PrpC